MTKKADAEKPAPKKASDAKAKSKARARKAAGQNGEIPFELLISETVVFSPRLKLGWRVPQTIADEIRQYDAAEKAFILLLIIDQETGESVRLSQPLLGQVMIIDYSFDHPGKYAILGTIAYKAGRCSCDLIEHWKGSSFRDYFVIETSDEAGRSWNIDFEALRREGCCTTIVGRAAIDLEISPKFFSKEPPKWLRKWVDGEYPSPSRNDCEFRRRALIWAFSIKPIWLVIWAIGFAACTVFWSFVFAVYMTVGAILGCRGLKWRVVRHPWTTEFKGFGTSWFTKKADGTAQPWLLRLLCPPVLLGLCALSRGVWKLAKPFAVSASQKWDVPLQSSMLYILGGSAAACLLIGGLLWIVKKTAPSVSQCLDKIENAAERWERGREIRQGKKVDERLQTIEQRKEAKEQLARAKRDIALGQLVTRPDLVKIELVPRERLSWYVRWLNIKAVVCRPFARYK